MTKITVNYHVKAFAGCLIVILLCLLNTGCGLIENKKSIDEKTVNEMTAKAKLLIEEITGQKFKSDLKFKIVNRKEFRKVMEKSLLTDIMDWIKDFGDDQTERRMKSSAKTRSRFYIARHFNRDNTVYIVQNNIPPMKEMYDIKDEDLNDFIFVTIAHEMVHGLDNQHYDLSKLIGESKDEESNRARGAVRGGSVGYVIGEIVDRLNISPQVYKSSLMLDICVEDESDPRQMEMYNLYYIKGREFIKAVVKEKGMEGYGLPFLSPPESTREIYYPETYLNKSDTQNIDLMKLVKKAAPALPEKSNMRSGIFATGTATLIGDLLYDGIDRKEAVPAAAECLNGITYQLVQPGFNPAQVLFTVLNFSDKISAVKYDKLLERIQSLKDDTSGAFLNTAHRLTKEGIQKKEAFDCLWFHDSGTKDNGKKGRSMIIAGVIDNLHISIRYEQMDDAKEQDMRAIMDMVYRKNEQLKEELDTASL